MTPDERLLSELTRFGFESVEYEYDDNRLRVLGRVSKSMEYAWKHLRISLLRYANIVEDIEERKIAIDISRQDILVEPELLYGWRLIFKSENLEKRLIDLVLVLSQNNPPAPVAASYRPQQRSSRQPRVVQQEAPQTGGQQMLLRSDEYGYEVPIPGADPNRGSYKGKGGYAGLTGQTPVGRDLQRRLRCQQKQPHSQSIGSRTLT